MMTRILLYGVMLANLNHHINFTEDELLGYLILGALALSLDLCIGGPKR